MWSKYSTEIERPRLGRLVSAQLPSSKQNEAGLEVTGALHLVIEVRALAVHRDGGAAAGFVAGALEGVHFAAEAGEGVGGLGEISAAGVALGLVVETPHDVAVVVRLCGSFTDRAVGPVVRHGAAVLLVRLAGVGRGIGASITRVRVTDEFVVFLGAREYQGSDEHDPEMAKSFQENLPPKLSALCRGAHHSKK